MALTVLTRVVKEADRATIATIGSTGGTISATSAEGVTYSFIVPPLALDKDVSITVTPIGRIGGLPFSGGLLGGVEFQPSGLKFGPGVLLVIKSAAAIPALAPNQRLVGFTFEGVVDSTRVQPALPRNGGLAISIEHFSSGGLAVGNVSDLSSLPVVPNGSARQRHDAELVVLNMPSDVTAAIAIFKAWRTEIEALIATAQSGTEAKISTDLYLNWRDRLTSFAELNAGPAGTAILNALTSDRAALVTATRAALQRGIASLNQSCVRFQNLLDAENVLYLRAYAETFSSDELTANGSGLTLTAQLATLCIKAMQSSAIFPNTFTANSSVALDATYGVQFGTAPALMGAFFDVTMTVAGAANNGTSTFQTDGTGRTLPRQIATRTTPITVTVKSCLARSQISFTAVFGYLQDVCHFSTFTANPPEVLSTSGPVLLISAPASIQQDRLEGSGTVLFREKQVTLPDQLVLDIANPGSYMASLSVGFVLAGTTVISYMIHADPVGLPVVDQFFNGSVTFTKDILGIISTSAGLDGTDLLLGAPGTVYPTGNDKRDAGVGPGSTDADSITLSADRRTVSFVMQLKNLGEMRVLLKQ